MKTPLTSMEQLMPFDTANELLAKKHEPLISAPPDSTVFDAVRLMAGKNVGFLVVLDRGELAGVLSDGDCARRVILEMRSAKDTTVRELMTTRVHTVPPDCKIPECVALMHANGIRHVPVTRDGKVLGVVSVGDVMGSLLQRHERLLRRLQEERLTLLYPDPSSY